MWRDRPTLVLGLVLAAAGLLLVSPSLGHPFFWDDLHWFRDYSFDELSGTWFGSNDPDELEIPGYRPLHATTNWLLYMAFGEEPGAYRVFAVAATATGLVLLAATLMDLGVPRVVAVASGLLMGTATHVTYLTAWPSNAYHAIQLVTFGAATWMAVRAVSDTHGRGWWLAGSLLAWAVTLMIHELALLQLGTVITVAALAASGGFRELAHRTGAPSFRRLGRALGSHAAVAWRDPRARLLMLGSVALAVLDTAGRFAFVPDAAPQSLDPHKLARTLVLATSLAGEQSWLGRWAYPALAVTAVAVMLVTPRLTRDERVTAPWTLALLALLAMAASSIYGLQIVRHDISKFVQFFYCVFLAAAAVSVHRSLGVRGRRVARPVAAVLVASSLTTSMIETVLVQQAFGRWSVQRLAYDYGFLYSDERTATVPAQRRSRVAADLRRVGLPDGRVPDVDVSAHLYCRALREPSFPARIPARFAFGPDTVDDFARCEGR